MKDIQVIENALPIDLYVFIKNEILKPEFQWSMNVGTAFTKEETGEKCNDISFAHVAYEKNYRYQTDIHPYLQSAFLSFTSNLPGIKNLIRTRVGLILPNSTSTSIIHKPHVDYHMPHWTGLLYFSSEEKNGHTYFYEDKYDPELYPEDDGSIKQSRLVNDVLKTIAAKENRLVIFRGDIFHSSSTPVDIPYRIAVNFNFTID